MSLYSLDQHYPNGLLAMIEMFYISAIQYGNHMTFEHLNVSSLPVELYF